MAIAMRRSRNPGKIDKLSLKKSSLINNLVAYWKLDETTGTRTDIVSGNNLSESVTNILSGSGKIGVGRSVSLNGSTEYLLSSSNLLEINNESFTIMCWVFNKAFSDPAAHGYIGKNNTSNNARSYILRYDTATTNYLLGLSANGIASSLNLTASNFGSPAIYNWHLLIGWWDKANSIAGISVNNTVNTATYSAGIFNNTGTPFTIGAYANSTFYANALIDGCALWKRALSPAERLELWNGGYGIDYPFS